jgi:hypothetical protein
MRRSVIAGVGAWLAWTALAWAAGPAGAQAAWSAPQTLDHPVSAAAGNARGEEVFAWQVRAAGKVGTSGIHASYIEAQVRLADGQLTPARPVSTTSGDATRSLGVGIDGRGAVTVTWVSLRRAAVMVATSSGTSRRFAAPVELPGRTLISDPVVLATAADGAAAIVRSTGVQLVLVTRPAARCAPTTPRACFGAPQVIRSPLTSEGFPSLLSPVSASFGPHDRLYITWPDHLAVVDGRQVEPTVATPTDGGPTALNPLGNGGAVLAWIGSTNANDMTAETAIVDPTGRHLSRATAVPAPWPAGATASCGQLGLATDPQGETTLVWGCIPLPPDGGRSPYDVMAASIRPAGGAFGVGAIVSPSDATASNPVVGVDTQGDTVLAYSVGGTVLGEVRPPAQAFGGPVTLDAGAPSLAVTAGDEVTLAWPGPGVGTTTLVDWVG